MSVFSTDRTVGDIVADMPKAAEVFKTYGIDFCCGGKRLLSDVLREQNINEGEVLEKLDRAYEKNRNLSGQTDFKSLTGTELIEYIQNIHHTYVKKTLPVLGEQTTTLLRAHGPNHPELFTVHRLFHTLKAELEQHLIKEEVILFPRIREYESSLGDEFSSRDVMKETMDEHETAGNVLKELREVTADYTVPEDGCETYRKTYEKLQELESDLFRHIHLENNILFKNLETRPYLAGFEL